MNLKYLVHCTAPATVSFKHGNWRGEPRWESNAVDALLTQGKTVHSTTNIWLSPDPRPTNLYDMNPDWMEESVQISYGVPHEIHTGSYPPAAKPKYRIVQYQDGPSQQKKDTFLRYDRALPGSIAATCSFKSGSYLSRLQKVLGKDNVYWTYGPTVPQVFPAHDSFTQPNLLWAYRNFCKYAEHDRKGMTTLFGKVADYLRSDTNAKLVMLIQPLTAEQATAISQDCRAFFLSFSFTNALQPFLDRVEVYTALDWCQVLQLMSETKLIISPAEPLGGPPFEAASYGVPTIFERNTNPFIETKGNLLFPEVLRAPAGFSKPFFTQLDRLNSDSAFYHKHGNAYRNFVDQHATYEAYVNKLEEIATQRGWNR